MISWPSNPQVNDIYVNGNGHKWKWNGKGWISFKEQVVDIFKEIPSGAINGTNMVYYLQYTPVTGSDHLYLNGLLQANLIDYTISGNVITFYEAPEINSLIFCTYKK